jgi:predicted nucleotidyltransferase
MNNMGLQQPDLDIILSVLGEFPNVKEAIIFGSRAKGNFRIGSDVDIAIKGVNLNQEIVSTISYRLNEETILPYKFDILDYKSIKNSKLAENINRIGITVYKK